MNKKGIIAKTTPPTPSTEKSKTIEYTPRGRRKTENLGGKRENAGRKKNTEREVKRTLTEIAEQHASEVVEMRIIDKATNTVRTESKTRAEWLLETLYNEGVNRKVIPAIKEYFDRTRGKAPQEVKHSGEIKTDEQRPPTPAELASARAYEEFE